MENKEELNKKEDDANTTTGSATSQASKPKVETIMVNKKVLDQILAKQESQDKEIEMLREVADKSRLYWWEEKNKKPTTKVVRLTVIEGKIVVGWKTIIDEVFQDTNGIFHEKQVIEIYFEDGTKKSLNYIDFTRLTNKIEVELIKRMKDEEQGTESVTVKTKEGKEYTIGIEFIN